MNNETDGFTLNGEAINGFNCKCIKCGSGDVNLDYEFNYYGGFTGYDMSLQIECESCQFAQVLDI